MFYKKEGTRTSKLESSNPSAFVGQPSISNIQQELGIVKKDIYNKMMDIRR